MKNDITVGTLYDRIWRNDSHPKRYILGMRVVLNAISGIQLGSSFNVNDLARRLRPHAFAQAGLFHGLFDEGADRRRPHASGLNEYEEEQPERDNTWVDFRVDANAAEPSGTSSAASPWVLVKTRAPTG